MPTEDMERIASTLLQAFNSGEFSQMIDLLTPGASFVRDDSDDEVLGGAFGRFEASDPSYRIVSSSGDIVETARSIKRNTPTLTVTLINGWTTNEDQQTIAAQVIWSRPEESASPTAQGRLLLRLSPSGSKIQSMSEQHEAIFEPPDGIPWLDPFRCICCIPIEP
jgi:hypothetical protein